MNGLTTVMLFSAGVAGGAINAIAGGATFITFPAMIAAGLPPTVANASSSLALTPGHFFGMLADRQQLPRRDERFWLSLAVASGAAAVGAVLLFVTTERQFEIVVPALIGIATLIFAFGRKINSWISAGENICGDRPIARLVWLVPTGAYVGYFGAGAGVVLMALFSLTSAWPVRTANAMKNLFGAIANWTAIGIFIYAGMIDWPATLPMLTGAVLGGLIGGKILHFVSQGVLRAIVIGAGAFVTVLYVWRFWL